MATRSNLPPTFENLEPRFLLSADVVDGLAPAEVFGDDNPSLTSNLTDDVGNTFDDARQLRLDSRGGHASAHTRGAVNYAGDVDMMSFVATEAGRVTVTQRARGGDRSPDLVSEVTAYDADGNLLATDGTSGSVSFRVLVGQQYYTAFRDVGDCTGSYSVRLTTVPEPFASAQVLDVGVAGTIAAADAITVAG